MLLVTRHIRNLYITGTLILFLVLSIPVVAKAEQSAPTVGVTVAPATLTLTLSKGEATQQDKVTVQNNTQQAVQFTARVLGVRQTGSGSLVPDEKVPSAIKESLIVSPVDFTIEPGKTQDIEVTVRDNAALGPGGHYAAIYVQQVNGATQGLSISQAVSIMAFIAKQDGALRSVSLGDITDDGNIMQLPSHITANFTATGNIGVTPRAVVTVHDQTGRELRRGILNEESLMAIPGRPVKVLAPLQHTGKAWLPGRYKTVITYRFDGTDAQQVATAYRFVVPPLFFVWLVGGSICLAGLVKAVLWSKKRFKWHLPGLLYRRKTQKAPVVVRRVKSMDIIAPPRTNTTRKRKTITSEQSTGEGQKN